MSSSALLSPLFLLSISLFLPLALAISPIDYSCPSGTFAPNSTYSKNLNNLLSYLDSETPLTGFSNGSLGLSPNRTYGLALCRGDINSSFCKACVDQASSDIQKICPLKKEAVVWYEFCELRYSNLSFFGQIDNGDKFYQVNHNESSNPVSFNQQVITLLKWLREEAIISPKLYANGALISIENSPTVYGVVQCTRDLSSANCNECLTGAINLVPKLALGRVGAKIWSGSCNVRYEIYQFYTA
ncbi:cysteine-rich repeat secretory protein 38-like [Rhododendron vialii]|uniref:cysteine-rich repeat secretory protein 38-like n=1 Tax=Rhododendron vialii TaxID=182163 RepID=UPI00265F63AB|nr:cysteine-rich repeat secretory protein 38-like [Rhododendron vialii]